MSSSFAPDALYLAIETSGPLGSVAVGVGAHVLARAFLDRQGRHAAELIPRVQQTLLEARVASRDLAGVVVGSGPGSFTGVRVAAATGKGISHALGLPLWPFSSLEAAAVAERVLPSIPALRGGPPLVGSECLRYVLFDARGERLYAACYRVGADGVEERIPPHATRIRSLLRSELHANACFVGDGAVKHESDLQATGHRVLPPPAGVPTADALLHLLALRPDSVPVPGAGPWEPQYVKASSAERARAV